jgi:hypothetical protein
MESRLRLRTLALVMRKAYEFLVSGPQKSAHLLLRPGEPALSLPKGPARQTSAQPGRAGASMDDDPERRRCGTFLVLYMTHTS